MAIITQTFPTWMSYAEAFCESLNSEYFDEKFPAYAKVLNTNNFGDLHIIKTLLNAGYNPQDGLNLFTNACLNGSRYLRDLKIQELQEMTDEFIKHGAQVTTALIQTLFQPTFKRYEYEEAEFSTIEAQCTMIDVFSKYNIDVSSYGDWKNIEGQYWEYIDKKLSHAVKRNKYFKYFSRYLASL